MGVIAELKELYNKDGMIGSQATSGLPAGQLAAGASWTTSGATITMAAALPSWVVADMNVYDVTNSQNIGTVSGSTGTTLTLSANASHVSSGAADVLQFGYTPSDLTAGATAGTDVRGLTDLVQLKLHEAIALLNYLTTDVITSSQDSAANTILAAAVTSLS